MKKGRKTAAVILTVFLIAVQMAFAAAPVMAASYKKVWLNCYKTIGHETLSKYAGEKIRALIIKTFETEGYYDKISEFDLSIICTFYEEALFGLMMRWLQDKLSDDPRQMKRSLDRIRVLFEGQLELLAKNSQNK